MLLSAIDEMVNRRVATYTQHLMAFYRSGGATHEALLGKVAEITAMFDLLQDLQAQVRRGEIAAQKEYGDGRP